MKVGRRGFLGLLGAATVSGPKAAAKGLNELYLGRVGALGALADGEVYPTPVRESTTWAVEKLAKKALISAAQREQKRRAWRIHDLDANTASLVSVSLGTKIRMSTKLQFEKAEENETNYLNRVIAGIEDW